MDDGLGLYDYELGSAATAVDRLGPPSKPRIGGGPLFWRTKRLADILVSLFALPVVIMIGAVLVLVNPWWNRGNLIYAQRRMGLKGKPFVAFKFRTMGAQNGAPRGPCDPVEAERITRLGRWLRVTRIDELPQFWNVLLGEMSLIGPRPDYYDHALHFAQHVSNYAERYRVRPGITGLAQVTIGYVEGLDDTRRKTEADLVYIRNAGWRMELRIAVTTLQVLRTGFGAR